MWKPLKTMVLALLCLLFSGIAVAETYYKIQVLSADPYRWKYVLASPQPVLIGKNQSLVTDGVAPPVVQYYVKKQVRVLGLLVTSRYVKAVPNPIVPASNQQIVNNPSALAVQQAFANQTPPPGTPTPPATTPQPVDPGTPVLTQNTAAPPKMAKQCADYNYPCVLPTTGVRSPYRFTVWYGNASKWHKKSWQSGTLQCNAASFGGDPTPAYKRCFYLEEYYLDRTILDNAGTNMAPAVNLSLVPAPNVGFPDAKIRAAGIPASNALPYRGAFRISCLYAFGSNDDPIVFPGVPNATHHHTFFGNTAVTAYSTNESLRASGNSTCAGGILNRSGYWMPSLVKVSNGAVAKPDVIVVYYKASDDNNAPYLKPPPAGLRMIAGNARPLAIANGEGGFQCQDLANAEVAPNYGLLWQGNHIKASCGGPNQMLRLVINFPECWDGVNLDSPDHKSHMAYVCGNECENAQGKITSSANACPASHPIAIPAITINADYYNLDASATYRLSSDNYPSTQPGGFSLHADWMNGWDQTIVQRMVNGCLVGRKNCGGPNLGDGETLWGVNTD